MEMACKWPPVYALQPSSLRVSFFCLRHCYGQVCSSSSILSVNRFITLLRGFPFDRGISTGSRRFQSSILKETSSIRMEVPVSSKEKEIEELSTDSLAMLSKASRVFNMGLQLGRNIMITTLFASSVPFVLPPLLMVSALGFAFSVPIGVIFATYTCTEKIMSKLLPVPGIPPQEKEFDSVMEAEERYQCEDNIQLLDQQDVAELEEEEETSAIDEDNSISEEEKEVGYEEDDEVTIDRVPKDEEKPVDQVCQLLVDISVDEKYGIALIVVEESVATFDGQISVGEVGDWNINEDDFSRETTDLLEKFRDEDDNTENTLEKPVTEMKGAERRVDEKENGSNKKLNVEELSYLSNGNKPETVGYGSVDVTDKDSVKNVDNGTPEASAGDLQTSGADEKSETNLDRIHTQVSNKDVTTEEQQQEEEKIWKQMNALREIIGYKGGGGTYGSCVDELKALFVFTGVEPPASFREQDALALADVNDSLQFLKSVVGVK